MLVFDLAGVIGFYALVAARAGANVIAFEPDPENTRSFAERLTMNGLEERNHPSRRVFAHVSHYDGGVARCVTHRNASVGADRAGIGSGFEVVCKALDGYLGSNVGPDLVKMDVEGAKLDILRVADRTIRVFRLVLFCEIHNG
jgi:FkbM family methyltransferase